jgi:glyoxylase-like metal-dependent hydrolase (beta-lactamase superfamily II)
VITWGTPSSTANYPFIDVDSGGSIDGMIAAADQVLATDRRQTKVIPGHGPLGTKADLQNYRNVPGRQSATG